MKGGKRVKFPKQPKSTKPPIENHHKHNTAAAIKAHQEENKARIALFKYPEIQNRLQKNLNKFSTIEKKIDNIIKNTNKDNTLSRARSLQTYLKNLSKKIETTEFTKYIGATNQVRYQQRLFVNLKEKIKSLLNKLEKKTHEATNLSENINRNAVKFSLYKSKTEQNLNKEIDTLFKQFRTNKGESYA
jgi:hypothetical protein